MTAPAPPAGGDPVARFFGGALMAVGALVAGLSGLCTVGVLVVGVGFSGGDPLGELGAGIPLMLVFGGVPFAIGVGIFYGGRALYRAGKPRPADPETFS